MLPSEKYTKIALKMKHGKNIYSRCDAKRSGVSLSFRKQQLLMSWAQDYNHSFTVKVELTLRELILQHDK